MKFVSFLFLLFIFTKSFAQELPSTISENGWNADSLGNHRVKVEAKTGGINKVSILWRRSDAHPEWKRIIVQDQQTGGLVDKTKTGFINSERGEIWFDAVSGEGIYYIYYMPYKNEGRSNYPRGVYLPPVKNTDSSWMSGLDFAHAPEAKALELQSVDEFNSLSPMNVIATHEETAAFVRNSKRKDWLVFPESRLYPITMRTSVPYRWIKRGLISTVTDTASKGENFSFQLGMYALKPLTDIKVSFSHLQNKNGKHLAAENMSCLNLEGVDYTGKPFRKKLDIPGGSVQSLWCLVNIPRDISPGLYTGAVTITASGGDKQTIPVRLYIRDSLKKDGGIHEPWKQTRLTWLNSTLAQKNTVIPPYTDLKVVENTISLLGRKVIVDETGLPGQIQSFFTQEMTGYQQTPNDLLTGPIHFILAQEDGSEEPGWKSNGIHWEEKSPGTVRWSASGSNAFIRMDLSASLEFDGFISYQVKFTALQDVSLSDIRLEYPFAKKFARYMMGMGEKGGDRKPSFEWKWDVAKKNQDGAWIGNVNAGLQFSLRDEHYVRPLNTNFYLQKPLLLPVSWGNDNKGGIKITENANEVLVNNYSGSRTMKKGDSLFYNFNLLITPFHPINTDFQWATRFYHRYNTVDSIKAMGATVINIHHATPINPWINYPFIEFKKMKAYVDEAHAFGLRVKIYNTIRELSDHAYETFPMRSLGHEIYSPGKGGGFSWLQEHVGEDYIPAWFVPEIKDAALVNSGMSRWHNYYVEGMNWLVQNVGIDGIYLDDVAFDRITMKRIKRVLTDGGHPGIIDLHSANQYNKNDGFNNSANLYMEHFPYLNRLWFGEYFDYNHNDPSFFLTEVSGIPFGLMGEMLQDGGNPWRGMIYGMTNRLPWSEGADPRAIWKAWDEFGMQGTAMIGYWSDHCPVKTGNGEILATAYVKKGATLVSIASWASADTSVTCNFDWKRLGMDPAKTIIRIPEIKNFQQAQNLKAGEALMIEKGKGKILILEEK